MHKKALMAAEDIGQLGHEFLTKGLPDDSQWNTPVMRHLYGSLAALHAVIGGQIADMHRSFGALLDGEALGLPDPCFAGERDEEQRRTNMLARLRGDVDLAYDDSSAESPAAITAYLARYGYQVEVWYSTPFRVGRNRVGDRLGALNGVLNVKVLYLCQPFRVGRNRVGQRLRICSQDGTEIECLLARIAPARFQINVIYL
ncbi:hypothetical protein [Burkholderia glumae]|uniref:hypothetical protein n=1 Tax=Burkholderia glumae TaxID=337 RepID=UPI0020B28C10|nr:hypothetical protein [Burkholderia glumae]